MVRSIPNEGPRVPYGEAMPSSSQVALAFATTLVAWTLGGLAWMLFVLLGEPDGRRPRRLTGVVLVGLAWAGMAATAFVVGGWVGLGRHVVAALGTASGALAGLLCGFWLHLLVLRSVERRAAHRGEAEKQRRLRRALLLGGPLVLALPFVGALLGVLSSL